MIIENVTKPRGKVSMGFSVLDRLIGPGQSFPESGISTETMTISYERLLLLSFLWKKQLAMPVQ
jgi:hypothetical protein